MNTVSDSIKMCLTKSKLKQVDLADRWHTTRQAISNKFYRDYWSADELADLAKFFGAQLIFKYPDGQEIPVTTDVAPRSNLPELGIVDVSRPDPDRS